MSVHNNKPAFNDDDKEVASASPACFKGKINSAARTILDNMAITAMRTGVLMF